MIVMMRVFERINFSLRVTKLSSEEWAHPLGRGLARLVCPVCIGPFLHELEGPQGLDDVDLEAPVDAIEGHAAPACARCRYKCACVLERRNEGHATLFEEAQGELVVESGNAERAIVGHELRRAEVCVQPYPRMCAALDDVKDG